MIIFVVHEYVILNELHIIMELYTAFRYCVNQIPIRNIFFQTGTTALFFAAQGGFVEIVRILLDNNAPVDSASVVSN